MRGSPHRRLHKPKGPIYAQRAFAVPGPRCQRGQYMPKGILRIVALRCILSDREAQRGRCPFGAFQTKKRELSALWAPEGKIKSLHRQSRTEGAPLGIYCSCPEGATTPALRAPKGPFRQKSVQHLKVQYALCAYWLCQETRHILRIL